MVPGDGLTTRSEVHVGPGIPKVRDSDAVPRRAFNPSTTGVLLEHLLHFVREIVSTVRAYDALQKLLHVYGPLAAGCHSHVYRTEWQPYSLPSPFAAVSLQLLCGLFEGDCTQVIVR